MTVGRSLLQAAGCLRRERDLHWGAKGFHVPSISRLSRIGGYACQGIVLSVRPRRAAVATVRPPTTLATPEEASMTRRTLVLVAVITMALASQPASAGGPNQGSGITAIPIVTGLAYPAAVTIAPDGRMFYGDRLTGNIRVYNPVDHSNKGFGVIAGAQTQGER